MVSDRRTDCLCRLLAFAGVFLVNIFSISNSISGAAEPNLAHLTSLVNTSSKTKQQLRSALDAYDSARRHGVKKQEPGTVHEPVDMREFPMNVYFTGKGKHREVEVEFCRLDYGAYQRNPEMYPMFTDLERAFCPDKHGEARRRVKLSDLTKACHPPPAILPCSSWLLDSFLCVAVWLSRTGTRCVRWSRAGSSSTSLGWGRRCWRTSWPAPSPTWSTPSHTCPSSRSGSAAGTTHITHPPLTSVPPTVESCSSPVLHASA